MVYFLTISPQYKYARYPSFPPIWQLLSCNQWMMSYLQSSDTIPTSDCLTSIFNLCPTACSSSLYPCFQRGSSLPEVMALNSKIMCGFNSLTTQLSLLALPPCMPSIIHPSLFVSLSISCQRVLRLLLPRMLLWKCEFVFLIRCSLRQFVYFQTM